MSFINVTTLDRVRIECVGEARAVTMTGGQWVEFRDKLTALIDAADVSLTQLDELAQVWGDEGVFRRCRERLRQAIADARCYQPTGQ